MEIARAAPLQSEARRHCWSARPDNLIHQMLRYRYSEGAGEVLSGVDRLSVTATRPSVAVNFATATPCSVAVIATTATPCSVAVVATVAPCSIAVTVPVSASPGSITIYVSLSMGPSPIPIVNVSCSPRSTSIHAAFAGIVTVHKLGAFLVESVRLSTTSLGSSFKRSTDDHEKRKHRKSPKVTGSFKLHELIPPLSGLGNRFEGSFRGADLASIAVPRGGEGYFPRSAFGPSRSFCWRKTLKFYQYRPPHTTWKDDLLAALGASVPVLERPFVSRLRQRLDCFQQRLAIQFSTTANCPSECPYGPPRSNVQPNIPIAKHEC